MINRRNDSHRAIPRDDKSPNLMSLLPTDGLRSIFHLLVGRPDSISRYFDRDVIISPTTITDLNDKITEKLKTHTIDGMIVSVDVSNNLNVTTQFGTWAEFLSHKWTTPDETKEIVIKWDFMVLIQGYEIPQRHSIKVRINRELKPAHILRQVLSEDREIGDEIEINHYPVVCRIDFVNHILSKELLNIVNEWNQSLPQPISNHGLLEKLKKKTQTIKVLISYSIPLLILLTSFSMLNYLASPQDPKSVITVGFLSKLMYWLMTSLSILYISVIFSNWLAGKAGLANLAYGKYSIFDITNGDKCRQVALNKKNDAYILQFAWSFGVALLLNVLSGLAVYWLT